LESSEKLGELDAFNIELSKSKLLCQNAEYPKWSPDGKKILYTFYAPSGFQIWQMNPDGTQKEFIVSGTHGNWSPDGEKIVFFSKKGGLSWNTYNISIFDLRQKKILYVDRMEFILDALGTKNEICDSHRLSWYQNIVVVAKARSWGGGTWVLNLDTLKYEENYRGPIGEAPRNYGLPNVDIEQIPNYRIPSKIIDHYYKYLFAPAPFFLYGIWAVSKTRDFSIRLLDNAAQPELSPNLDKLVYVKLIPLGDSYKAEIHCSEFAKSSETERKFYEVELGAKNGVKEHDTLIIAEPKINPLNNKIIGYSKIPKAIVTISSVKEDTCLVFPNVIIQVFGIGDIATYEGKEVFGRVLKESSEYGFYSFITTRVSRKNISAFGHIAGDLKTKSMENNTSSLILEDSFPTFGEQISIKKAQQIEVIVTVLPEKSERVKVTVEVTEIRDTVSDKNKYPSANLVLTLINPPPNIKPGMFASASFVIAEKENVLAIPIPALVNIDNRWGVFIIKNDRAYFEPVDLGLLGEGFREVKFGLLEGQEIVVGPFENLRELKDGALLKNREIK
jgi:hypothetical protein